MAKIFGTEVKMRTERMSHSVLFFSGHFDYDLMAATETHCQKNNGKATVVRAPFERHRGWQDNLNGSLPYWHYNKFDLDLMSEGECLSEFRFAK